MNNRWIYIDFNSYFASVEQQLNPELRNKPIAVVPVHTDFSITSGISQNARMKKISVLFSELEEATSSQYEFLTDLSKEKGKKVSRVLDLINQKYGKDTVSFGVLPNRAASSETKIAFTRIPDKEEFLE